MCIRDRSKIVIDRIEKELKVITDMNFAGYFLITLDIVKYSISRGFLHVGRGSGANSIVSYLLGITAVSYTHLDVYKRQTYDTVRTTSPSDMKKTSINAVFHNIQSDEKITCEIHIRNYFQLFFNAVDYDFRFFRISFCQSIIGEFP